MLDFAISRAGERGERIPLINPRRGIFKPRQTLCPRRADSLLAGSLAPFRHSHPAYPGVSYPIVQGRGEEHYRIEGPLCGQVISQEYSGLWRSLHRHPLSPIRSRPVPASQLRTVH